MRQATDGCAGGAWDRPRVNNQRPMGTPVARIVTRRRMSRTTSLKTLLFDNTMPADDALIEREPDSEGGADAIRCFSCGHRCLVKDGRAGVCRVRFNRGGELRVPAGYV